MWVQRSRTQWLANEDRNTHYFHGVATHRKRKNFIKGIVDLHGTWVTDEEAIGATFMDFYSKLFTTSCPS